jgi:hypothetical protein
MVLRTLPANLEELKLYPNRALMAGNGPAVAGLLTRRGGTTSFRIDRICSLDDHLHTPGGIGCADPFASLYCGIVQVQAHLSAIGHQRR